MLDIFKGLMARSVPLFDHTIITDYYDGPVTAICKIAVTDNWVICDMVYSDARWDKIYTIIEVKAEWVLNNKALLESTQIDDYKKKRKLIKSVSKNHKDGVFLIRCDRLDSVRNTLVEIAGKHLVFYGDIDRVFRQKRKQKLKWISFFVK